MSQHATRGLAMLQAQLHRQPHQGSAAPVPLVGTIFGQHTIPEVEELLFNLQNRITDVGNTFASLTPAELAKDPSLASDWGAFSARWLTGKSKANDMLWGLNVASPVIPRDKVPAERVWNDVLLLANTSYPSQYKTTDLPGLQIRIQALKPIEWKAVEKNRVDAPDTDLRAYKKVDATIKGGEKTFSDFIAGVPWWAWVLGAGIVGVAGLTLYRYLRGDSATRPLVLTGRDPSAAIPLAERTPLLSSHGDE